MERIAQDIRFALRGFRRTPTFPIAVLVVLATSIGAAVAMFTTTRAVLLQQLPVMQPERLAVLTSYEVPAVEKSPPATVIRQLRRQMRTVTDIAGVGHWGVARSPFVEGERTRILSQALVTSNYFAVLGAKAFLGRLLVDADEDFGKAPPMVLSYAAWQSKFAADSSVIGRKIVWPYTRLVYTIVGVAPPGLDYPRGVDCWTPVDRTDGRQTLAVVRLAPGVSLAAAQAEYFEAAAKLQPSYRLSGASGKLLMDVVVGDVRPALAVLTGAVALLLLIACVNVANLFLVRAGHRARELALRRVLGASYWSTVRQLIVESALLAICGGVLGTASAFVLLRVLVLFAPQQLPRLDMVRIDSGLFAIALSITTLSVLVFGVAPALIAASASGEKTLRASSRTGAQTRFRSRLRDGLVASQVSLALILLVAAGLLSRSLLALQSVSLGYDADHLTIASIAWDATKSDTPAEILSMGQQMQERLQVIPGVQSVTPIVVPPFFGTNVWHGVFEAETSAGVSVSALLDAPIEIGSTSYFETMGVPIKLGRGFLDSDQRGATDVVVISESVARHFWPKANALGNRIRFFSPNSPPEEWYTVVGVVPDTRFRALRESTAMVYRPWQQEEGWQGIFAIRSSREPNLLAPHIREAARIVDPNIVLGDLRSMNSELSAPLSTPRLMALLLSAFGGIAFFLAAVGLYGVLASTVRDQTREIGIRSALGATPAKLVLAVVQHALFIAGIGTAVGMGFALALTRSMQSLLYETGPTDPVTLITVTVMLLVVAMLSASAPALSAARVQPMTALRME